MGGFLAPDEQPLTDNGPAAGLDGQTADVLHEGATNGNGAAATPMRLNIHPTMLVDVSVVPFAPAPESHLLDLNNSHETPAE